MQILGVLCEARSGLKAVTLPTAELFKDKGRCVEIDTSLHPKQA